MEDEVIRDPVHGYLRLNPIPEQDEITEFYKDKYVGLIDAGSRAPGMRRQRAGGEESDIELNWLNNTLYADILYVLAHETLGRNLLDVGCGTGAFLRCANKDGWSVVGIEPSEENARISADAGVSVFNNTLEMFAESQHTSFNAITLLNTLEHVPDPVAILLTVKNLLKPDGVVCIKVPNDFSALQLRAERNLNKGRWWVVSPDHINYFNFESLHLLLEEAGLEVVYKTTDFPMELFLLMGDDYTDDPAIGSECHTRRRNLELALPDVLRRRMYHSLAEIGIGRSCIVFAKEIR